MAFKISVTGKLYFFVWRSLLTTFTACVAAAQVPKLPLPYTLSAPSVAAGGVAQIRVTLAAPHQITSCDVSMELDPAVFGPVTAVDTFSATGDQFGTTLISDNRLRTSIGSDSGALGQLPGTPMLVITVPVLPNAVSGATTVISIPSTDFLGNPVGCTDAFGYQYTLKGIPTLFRVGGAFSIDSVTPGGGLLPAGTRVHLAGRGFTADSAVEIEGVALSSIAYLGPQAIDVTIAVPADLTGRRVLIKNADGALADFYPALFRKTETGGFLSGWAKQPIFPQQTHFKAFLGTTMEAGYAIQNPTLERANLVINIAAGTHRGGSSRTISLEAGESHIYPAPPATDTQRIEASSETPLRMMRFLSTLPDIYDTLALKVTWNGPGQTCNAEADSASTALPCWLGTAGAAPLEARATVEWNRAVPFSVTSTTEGGQWLTLTTVSNLACASTPCAPQIKLAADPRVPPGDYKATVTVTPQEDTLLPQSFSFIFRVAGSTVSLDAPSYIYFSVNDSIDSRGPAKILVKGTADGTPFSVKVNGTNGGDWLSVSPMQGTTPAVLSVYVNPGSTRGSEIGSIYVSGPSNTVRQPVNMVVTNAKWTDFLVATPSAITLWAKEGATAPSSQFVLVSQSCDDIKAETEGSLAWLSARKATEDVYAGLSVSASASGLKAGVYRGTVTFGVSGSTHYLPGQLPVTLVVWAETPAVSFTPSSVALSAPSRKKASQPLSVTGSNGPISIQVVSATTGEGVKWLTTSTTVGSEAGSLTVSADATSLPPGTYQGSLQIRAPADSPVLTAIPVVFTVTPNTSVPRAQRGMTLTASIANSASMVRGPVVPGELVTILGLNLGPAEPASLQLDEHGRVSTTLGGSRVLFDGVPAPLLYASPTQINAVVPYEIEGKTSAVVSVEHDGMRFTTGVPVVAAAPALFTADGSGRGQARAFNPDNTANSETNAVARGDAVAFFVTGAGQTVPSGVTGELMRDDTYQPVLPIAVKIADVAATVRSVRSVPGQPAGLLQVTAMVPKNIMPGPAAPVTLTAGTASSSSDVTIAVK